MASSSSCHCNKKVWGSGFRYFGVRHWKKSSTMHKLETECTAYLRNVGMCQEPQMSKACIIAFVVARPIHWYNVLFLRFVITNIFRSARFWDFTQRRMVIPYRRFGITYRYRIATMLHKIPEQRRLHMHRDGSPKARKKNIYMYIMVSGWDGVVQRLATRWTVRDQTRWAWDYTCPSRTAPKPTQSPL
jgi:hypothetical protein